ncbi:hypothetical protein RvY_16650 [Ramazzottius varieornatus]|uniref:Uncharacterized protein n=1 Tax=Ramazzottius varieornatus TaxID=947166 RepID=A0A1D1VZ92_RAMVA|nr:hypothetical protein RvY_16650 [Ramazzottius varieornatus]
MDYISSVVWVPRGKAKPVPDEVKLKPEELKVLLEEKVSADPVDDTDDDDDDDDNDTEEKEGEANEWVDEEEEEDHGEEDTDEKAADEDEPEEKAEVVGEDVDEDDETDALPSTSSNFTVSSLAVFPVNDDDPYLVIKDEDDVDSEDEDFKIQPGDNLLAVAHVDEDANVLEVYVYNEENDDLYVHHDILLPACPLVLEWLPYQCGGPQEQGNFVAVGSMESTIQIWDLDMVNVVEPVCELKGFKKKRKRDVETTSAGSSITGHRDAVLALAWNSMVEHIMASGSADSTVILWDLDRLKAATVLTGFEDKVQAIKWRPDFGDQLLCGSCDKTVRLFDCRLQKAKATLWNVEDEVERVAWSSFNNQYFYVATESGQVYSLDVRNTADHLSVIQAHGKTVTGLVSSPFISGMLLTTSEDKRIRVWDVNTSTQIPEMILERKLKMGEIQFSAMSPDSPFTVALAGEDSDSNFRILDLYKTSEEVRRRFESRTPAAYIHARQEEEKRKEEAAEELKIKKEKKQERANKTFKNLSTPKNVSPKPRKPLRNDTTPAQNGEKKKRWSRDKRGKNSAKDSGK